MEKEYLCEVIQKKLSEKEIILSIEDIEKLYDANLDSINEILNSGDTLSISNLGKFWRKDGITSALTFFKSSNKLIDQINNKHE